MIDRIRETEEGCENRGIAVTSDLIRMAAKNQTGKGEDVFETFERYINREVLAA